jgi:hypothetical protein
MGIPVLVAGRDTGLPQRIQAAPDDAGHDHAGQFQGTVENQMLGRGHLRLGKTWVVQNSVWLGGMDTARRANRPESA